MKVEIRKGDMTATVSKTAFDNFFKSTGWKVVGENPATEQPLEKSKVEDVDSTETSDDENWDEAIDDVEKPISEMTRDELIEYANKNNIDIDGINKTHQIREAIMSNM